jgi:hypothetical protein
MTSDCKSQVIVGDHNDSQNDEDKNYRQDKFFPGLKGQTAALELVDVCVNLTAMALMLVHTYKKLIECLLTVVEYAEVFSVLLCNIFGDYYIKEWRQLFPSPAFKLSALFEAFWHH